MPVLCKSLTKHDVAAPLISHLRPPRPTPWHGSETAMLVKYINVFLILFLSRILGGSCNNEWIVEETGNETDNDGDIIASCMETDDDEKGKDN